MKRVLTVIASVAAIALPISVSAQDADNQIVVEGQRIDPERARDMSRDISSDLNGFDAPMARFQNPICVGIWGLPPDFAEPVINRVYDNAERAGIEVDDSAGCNANVWAIFVDDPAETFEQLRDEDSFLLRQLSWANRNRVKDQSGPVRAWHITSTRDRGGMIVATGEDTLDPPVNSVTSMSRLQSAVRFDLEKSVVLIQRSAIVGMDVHSLGDYISMRSLAPTVEPDAESANATVLGVFTTGPTYLTDFDRAYLQTLYASASTTPGRNVHGRVGSTMETMRTIID